MRTTLRRVLTIDKGIVLLALAALRVGQGNLDILTLEVNDIVHDLATEVVGQEIL